MQKMESSQLITQNELKDRLLMAIPKKGRLNEPCMQLLKGADLKFRREPRLDIAFCTNLPIAIVFLPAKDIPKFVGEGNVDMGITGEDVIQEEDVHDKVKEVLRLGIGKCKLCVQVFKVFHQRSRIQVRLKKSINF